MAVTDARGFDADQLDITLDDSELILELPVWVEGFKPQIDGADRIIRRVTHRVNDQGLTTVLELEVLARALPD